MNWSSPISDAESHSTRRRLLATVGTGLAATLAGCTVAGDTERRTAEVEDSVTGVESVAIDADDATTTVESRDGDAVQIRATKYAIGQTDLDDVRLTQEVTDGHLSVGVERSGGITIGTAGGGLESLTVSVPAGVDVTELTMDDGDATVDGVAGDLALSVDDGTAEVGTLDGAVDVEGDDGEITVDAVDALRGEIDDGSLTVTEGTRLGDVQADDGKLDLAVDGVDDGATVSADDGDVTVRLSQSLDLSVTVSTDDGAVQVADDVLDDIETSEDETRGQIGDGSDALTIEVDDGSVTLEPL